MKEYMIVFSSFYKAAYAQEKLSTAGIRATLKKIPPDLMRSCGYALFMNGGAINAAMDTLRASNINWIGVYAADRGKRKT